MFSEDYTLDLSLVSQLKSFEQVQLKYCVPTSQGFSLRLIQRMLITPKFSYFFRQCVPPAVIGFPSPFFGVLQVEILNHRGKKARTWLSLHINQTFVPVLSWVQVCHCSSSTFDWWPSKIWRAFEKRWNIPKWMRGMQGQNKYCTCSFFLLPFSWMFFLSKVCSLQLKLFSWC